MTIHTTTMTIEKRRTPIISRKTVTTKVQNKQNKGKN